MISSNTFGQAQFSRYSDIHQLELSMLADSLDCFQLPHGHIAVHVQGGANPTHDCVLFCRPMLLLVVEHCRLSVWLISGCCPCYWLPYQVARFEFSWFELQC